MNSRHIKAKYSKAPMSKVNQVKWEQIFRSASAIFVYSRIKEWRRKVETNALRTVTERFFSAPPPQTLFLAKNCLLRMPVYEKCSQIQCPCLFDLKAALDYVYIVHIYFIKLFISNSRFINKY